MSKITFDDAGSYWIHDGRALFGWPCLSKPTGWCVTTVDGLVEFRIIDDFGNLVPVRGGV